MLLVVVVNAVLVAAAIGTFAGTTTGRAYDRGRAYNRVLAEADRQAALGWTAQVALADDRLTLTVTDRAGLAAPGRVEGLLLRPLQGTTVPLDLAAVAAGRWSAPVGPLAPGQWEARLTLVGPGEARLDIRQRVMAP